ncbi:hypothetical protein [Alicyclobacillus sp. ALC3]|uniref:hypothetical protein n=1 Tax=Alicyclobacillus sp. ALC3 TaxID=2796143 RepID=UPI002378761E|nr:hypothetical protein [Alicyclobacillus sp. ALC3]WDL96295.1 hypothetical protein JC200_18470 [Alicyclobacillus sp. ALC3]
MNGTLLGVIALGLVLVCLWIWMNILLTRPPRRSVAEDARNSAVQAQSGVSEERSSDKSTDQTVVDGAPSGRLPEPEATPEVTPEVLAAAGALAGGPLARPNDSSETTQEVNSRPPAGEAHDLEVVSSRRGTAKTPKIFDRSETHPFRMNTFVAPSFEDKAWVESFYRLHEDPSVVGWIAFQNNSVGASDRDYEDDFVDVLRTYKRSVEKLRRQVGLTTVMETSVVGEEGKVWFLSPVEDVWLALFVDKQADLEQMTKRLLGPVQSDSTDS